MSEDSGHGVAALGVVDTVSARAGRCKSLGQNEVASRVQGGKIRGRLVPAHLRHAARDVERKGGGRDRHGEKECGQNRDDAPVAFGVAQEQPAPADEGPGKAAPGAPQGADHEASTE